MEAAVVTKCTILRPFLPASFQEVERPYDVGVDEVIRTGDRSINVGFSGKVDDMSDGVVLHDRSQRVLVTKIDFLEAMFGVAFHVSKTGEIAGVRQAIEIDETLKLGAIDDGTN